MARPKSPNPKKKITVYVPLDVLKIVDANVADLSGSRSQAFVFAMRRLLKQKGLLAAKKKPKAGKKSSAKSK